MNRSYAMLSDGAIIIQDFLHQVAHLITMRQARRRAHVTRGDDSPMTPLNYRHRSGPVHSVFSTECSRANLHFPMRIPEKEWRSPVTFSIHRTTAMTTTALRIDLMVLCIGIKRFTSQRTTPTTISTS